jgi:uncharacterized protein (DUF3820 family)
MSQHEQHTKKFIAELNATKNNKINPIQESSMTWKFGKYKGYKLKDIPIKYLKWALNKMNLSDTAKCLINLNLGTEETEQQ